jgi:hypothetical protein
MLSVKRVRVCMCVLRSLLLAAKTGGNAVGSVGTWQQQLSETVPAMVENCACGRLVTYFRWCGYSYHYCLAYSMHFLISHGCPYSGRGGGGGWVGWWGPTCL